MTKLDILTFPTAYGRNERDRERELTVIPEDASIRDASPVPSWVLNPPVDYSRPTDSEQDGGSRVRDIFSP